MFNIDSCKPVDSPEIAAIREIIKKEIFSHLRLDVNYDNDYISIALCYDKEEISQYNVKR